MAQKMYDVFIIDDTLKQLVEALEEREVKRDSGMAKDLATRKSYALGYVISTVGMAMLGLPKTQQKKMVEYLRGSIDYVKEH